MNKTIIAIFGRSNQGKSDTIKRVCKILLKEYPNAISSHEPNYKGDILLTIQLGNIKIGLESQGDPNSRMINSNTIKKLADETSDSKLGNCDIIICASRTRGKTVKKVDEIARKYEFHTLWISSFFSPNLNHKILNNKAARNIIDIINSLIVEQL